jgi:AraC-like DNA-binding protein
VPEINRHFVTETPLFAPRFSLAPLHVVALLPRQLLDHLRHVLGQSHRLEGATDVAELHSLLRAGDADLLVVDPTAPGHMDAVEMIIGQHPMLPVVIYTMLQPSAVRNIVKLAQRGVQHVVLNRFDDEPRRFLDLLERVPAHPMAELMLEELAGPLRALPVVVARAVEQLLRAPNRVKNSQELADLAGMAPRTLYRHLTPAGLQPRRLIICARLLRAYPMLRTPGSRLKEVAARLGYSDPDTLSSQLEEWTGRVPKNIKQSVPPELFVRLIADRLLRAEELEDSGDST